MFWIQGQHLRHASDRLDPSHLRHSGPRSERWANPSIFEAAPGHFRYLTCMSCSAPSQLCLSVEGSKNALQPAEWNSDGYPRGSPVTCKGWSSPSMWARHLGHRSGMRVPYLQEFHEDINVIPLWWLMWKQTRKRLSKVHAATKCRLWPTPETLGLRPLAPSFMMCSPGTQDFYTHGECIHFLVLL